MTDTPKVCAALINWNSLEDTSQAVHSLLNSSYHQMTTLVVDNNSTDRSLAELRKRFGDRIAYLPLKQNTGMTGGSNAALDWSVKKGFRYTLIGNTDIAVASSAVRHLVARAESDSRIGFVNPKIYRGPEGSRTIYFAGAKRNWGICYGMRGAGLDERLLRKDQAEDMFWAVGTFALYRNQMITETGGFDESFFLGLEDVEFGSRATKLGWKGYYEPRAKVWHQPGGSAGGRFGRTKSYYGARNMIRLIQKGYWSGPKLLFIIPFIIGFTLSPILLLRFRSVYWGLVGISDGLRGKFGKTSRF